MERTQYQQIFKCSVHNLENATFVNTSSVQDKLSCDFCILQQNQNNNFVSIKQIIDSQEQNPIYNWPKGIQQEIFYFLVNNSKCGNEKEQKIQQINLFYKELQSQILKCIEDSKNEQLQLLENIDFQSKDLMKFYNECFKKNELKQLFSQQNEFQVNQYQQILVEIEQNKQQNLKSLEEKINLVKQSYEQIQFNQANYIKIIVKNLIQQINLTYNHDLPVKSDIQQNKQSNNSNQQDQNITYLQNLINLITNYINLLEKNNDNENQKRKFDSFLIELNNKIKKQPDSKFDNHSINTSEQLNLQLSDIYDSKQFILSKDENNNWQFTNNNKIIYGQVFSQQLNKNKSYIFRIKFIYPLSEFKYCVLGLIKESDLKNYLEYSRLCIGDLDYTNIIKGNKLTDLKTDQSVFDIEIRFNINKQILQFSDYPNNNNISQIDGNKINPNDNFRFGIYLNQQNETNQNKMLTITYYKEFDQWQPFI